MVSLPRALIRRTRLPCDSIRWQPPARPAFRQLDVFLKVAEDRSFAAAARRLGILHVKDIGDQRTDGLFVPPVIAEIPLREFLEREALSPIYHIYRYDRANLGCVARRVAARGDGLTLGVHSRVEALTHEISSLTLAGICYVNRSIPGAVVGVQPFGGEGLSGIRPKAGGPHSLLRCSTERALSINITAQVGDPPLLNL